MSSLTAADIDAIFASGNEQLIAAAQMLAEHPLYRFKPRQDRPDEFDEQSGFVNDLKNKFTILLGGNGSGKTLAAAAKTARYVLNKKPMRKDLPFWIIGEDLEQICDVAWKEKLSNFIPESEILDYHWLNYKMKRPKAVVLRHPENRNEPGWVFHFKSYQQQLGSAKGYSIGGYWFNDEVPYELVAEVLARCRDFDSPGWADFTPVECRSPEWPDAYEHPPPGWRFYHLNSLMNNAIAEGGTRSIAEFSEDFLKTLPEDMRELRQLGRFTVLRGAVYKEFRKSTHVIEPFRIPAHWPRMRGIDFGFNNPFCCLWAARDPDGRYYIYDEHYEAQQTVAYQAAKVNERDWDDSQPWYGRTWGDHDATWRNELNQHGIYCTLANKDIHAGIETVRSAMMVKGDGKPQLFIFNTCKNLIREIPGYKYPEGTDVRAPKEAPIDTDNHCLVAGTLIETIHGRIPIEDVCVGELVLTRDGYNPIVWSGPTVYGKTMKVTLSNGQTLSGTTDHPLWVIGHGWKEIGDLCQGDELVPVARNLSQTSTHENNCAHVHVVSVTAGNCEQTYDLTVVNSHEFFANGVLVHNSLDALRYVLHGEKVMAGGAGITGKRVLSETKLRGVQLTRKVK